MPFQKGNTINKGKKRSEETKLKMSLIKQGNKNYRWKGDKVGYSGLHIWIRKMLGSPKYCEHCKTTKAKKFEWANKSHLYKRELTDWIRLCTSCHRIYDRKSKLHGINDNHQESICGACS